MKIRLRTLFILLLILGAGVFGWWLGRSDEPSNLTPSTNTQQTPVVIEPDADTTPSSVSVKSLVTYELPDGWKEQSCPSSPGSVFIVPVSAPAANCNANPSAPVKISVDPGNHKDCNQLQNVQNVSKHICISEFINERKSLKAETIYNKDSSYKKETTVRAYYIDLGTNVVKVEYIYDGEGTYTTGWEQLAKSVAAKS